ncbi:PQQ-dependent sugar dehydrogenase [Adhaeribacter pallidiroseus]|uniref:Soluble aldose sugar dehydrogenase YliI n=1 Tax=Adhaeribacter pallidiroseus TaxID=2072847 RepID=A0A369QJ23_9BACT|nr:PQQ-dependent sugar dehydrogenase [Adhaeribacter pallidiroseus]RDC62288.1 Soluble aldose sugar dehydrogenase YliI [Adhaeribacter pallidiroseus]
MNKSIFLLSALFLWASFTVADKPEPIRTAKPAVVAKPVAFTVEKLHEGFTNPWGMAWLPDGRLLVTERAGDILVFKNNKFTGEKLSGVPKVFAEGQGGLLDIKLHPDYATNKWIYISYAKPVEGGATTAIMRFKLQGNQLVEKKDIFEAQPYLKADFHFGSRIVFDKDKFLYFSSGERGTQPKVQELNNDHGKIHRIYDDGRVPQDNPFVNQKDARPTIWTYGHRNPQGMVYDATTNRIWAVEHGPKGGDELNLIQKGKNYGWPKTSYGINYDGTILTEFKEMAGVTNPVRYWVPSIGPCGMAQVTSDRYPEWKGNLLVGALAFRHIARVQLNDAQYVTEEKLVQDIGRVRCVAESPDGYIYAITEGPGLLIRLTPNKS